MHAEKIKKLWAKHPNFRQKVAGDIRLVRQYSLLMAILMVSAVYRVLAVLIVHIMYLMLGCVTNSSSSYVLTLSAENACFVSILLWSGGASAAEGWTAGLANRMALPLMQAGFVGAFCANLVHFFATAVSPPDCWPAYFTGILWGVTWLNVASVVIVSCLLVHISSPLNLFDPVPQTDTDYEGPKQQWIDRTGATMS